MNSRLLPQNKALFGLDQLAKFLFVQKYVPMKMKTPLWRRARVGHETTIDHRQKWPEEVDPAPGRCSLAHVPRSSQTPAFGLPASWGRWFRPPLTSGGRRIELKNGDAIAFQLGRSEPRREKEREKSYGREEREGRKERKKKRKRKRGWGGRWVGHELPSEWGLFQLFKI